MLIKIDPRVACLVFTSNSFHGVLDKINDTTSYPSVSEIGSILKLAHVEIIGRHPLLALTGETECGRVIINNFPSWSSSLVFEEPED